MKVVAETKRLVLRQFVAEDAQDFFNLNNDPRNIRYTGNTPFASLEHAQIFLKNYKEYKQHGFGRWAVILKSHQIFIGWAGIKRNDEGFVDLGYRFFYNYWGQGYATESGKACLKVAFQDHKLDRIVGRVASANTASIRVLDKLGFTFWKEQACNGIDESLYYQISKNAYQKIKS